MANHLEIGVPDLSAQARLALEAVLAPPELQPCEPAHGAKAAEYERASTGMAVSASIWLVFYVGAVLHALISGN